MNDVKWITIENCRVFKVYQELPLFTHRYNIILHKQKENSIFDDSYEVRIDSSTLFDNLMSLKNNKKERCYFGCGMADIDVYRAKNGDYVLHDSPASGMHILYMISEEEFDKLINNINPVHLDLYLKRDIILK
jgi:hypothetical protein